MNPKLVVLWGILAVYGGSKSATASPYNNGGTARLQGWQQLPLDNTQNNNGFSSVEQHRGSQETQSESYASREEGSSENSDDEESGSRSFEIGSDEELRTYENNPWERKPVDQKYPDAQAHLEETESSESGGFQSDKDNSVMKSEKNRRQKNYQYLLNKQPNDKTEFSEQNKKAAQINDDVNRTIEQIRKNKEQKESSQDKSTHSQAQADYNQKKSNSYQPRYFSGDLHEPINKKSESSSFLESSSTSSTNIDGVMQTVSEQGSDTSASVAKTNNRGEIQRSGVQDTTESESEITSKVDKNGQRQTSTSQETAKTQSENKSNTNSRGKTVTSGIQDTEITASQSDTDGKGNTQFVKAFEDTSKTTEQGKIKNFSSSQKIVQSPRQAQPNEYQAFAKAVSASEPAGKSDANEEDQTKSLNSSTDTKTSKQSQTKAVDASNWSFDTTDQIKTKSSSNPQKVVQSRPQHQQKPLRHGNSNSLYDSQDIRRKGSSQSTATSSSTLRARGENASIHSSSLNGIENIEPKSFEPSETTVSAISKASYSKFNDDQNDKKGRYDLQKTSNVERALETDIHLRTLIIRNDVDGGQCYCSCDNNSKPVFISMDGKRV